MFAVSANDRIFEMMETVRPCVPDAVLTEMWQCGFIFEKIKIPLKGGMLVKADMPPLFGQNAQKTSQNAQKQEKNHRRR